MFRPLCKLCFFAKRKDFSRLDQKDPASRLVVWFSFFSCRHWCHVISLTRRTLRRVTAFGDFSRRKNFSFSKPSVKSLAPRTASRYRYLRWAWFELYVHLLSFAGGDRRLDDLAAEIQPHLSRLSFALAPGYGGGCDVLLPSPPPVKPCCGQTARKNNQRLWRRQWSRCEQMVLGWKKKLFVLLVFTASCSSSRCCARDNSQRLLLTRFSCNAIARDQIWTNEL